MSNVHQSQPVPAGSGDSKPRPDTKLVAFDLQDLIDRLMGSEEMARQVVGSFAAYIPRQLAALACAIEGADTEQTRTLAHKIKGAAANVSGAALAQAASIIEVAAVQGDLCGVRQGFSELTVEFAKTSSELADFLTPR
jgi:HPt (histidine-containing phosphotransfer) domain-containing protein